ncbi:DUF3455 domain-containing protein [Dyella acidiphila]|uniref:DUF3455 domain-containing protein n=1 Tax=Dyella acidiphila TaxID=2775866 RepID=A0ABR9G703_9GAMM|nr:DUF3455 domain-containing protein [Dyella acidiphila]MBE1159829.1 DUF3455 domain-containing protein [Dyella acidiphila]
MHKSLMSCAVLSMALAGAVHAQAATTKPAAFEALGKGVQIYTCSAAGGAYAWHLKAPDASLLDAKGQTIGKHFAGPSWQANDGSTVVAEPLTAAPSPDAGAVAWLVLHAKSHSGSGTMAAVQYIVRAHTEGGVAPATGCDAGHAGTEVRVPYSALYQFFP